MHVLPRKKGDFKEDEIFDYLENHDKPNTPYSIQARSREAMAEEAAYLRKMFYDEEMSAWFCAFYSQYILN